MFLLSGTVLLTITYLLARSADQPTTLIRSGRGYIVVPIARLNSLQAAAARSQVSQDLNHQLIQRGIALVIMAVLSVVLGWYIAGRALRPVSTITAMARRISATNLHERLALDAADEEFKQLGNTLNSLFERLEASFAAQRHFVANASHELRTPLTRERTLLQVALADPSTSEVWQSTGQELLASNREQESIIEALLALASSEGEVERHEPIELAIVVHAALGLNHPDADRLGLNVEATIASAALEGDPDLIERLVANLLDNAIGHNVEGGRVHLSICTKDGHAVLSISNSGSMIPPTEIDRLFEPFQRLDSRRAAHSNGHGLGLSIVQAIATAHGATIIACPGPRGGLSIEVVFPKPIDKTIECSQDS